MSTTGINDDRAGDHFRVEGMRGLALGEMARGRRRLGDLTPEQERALESLLVSVADNISELVSGVAAGAPRRERVEEARAVDQQARGGRPGPL
jgi:hypothetical protein